MKSELEIQRAHDLIVPVLLGDVKVKLDERAKLVMHAAADVLCWVLDHDHNDAFAQNIEQLEQKLKEKGFILERGDQ